LSSRNDPVIIGDGLELIEETRTILAADSLRLGAGMTVEDGTQFIREREGEIIFLAFSSPARVKNFLFDLYREGIRASGRHQVIALCGREDAGETSSLVLEGLVDDYFICRPVYDRDRFAVIIRQAGQRLAETRRLAAMEEERSRLVSMLGEFEQTSRIIAQQGEKVKGELSEAWEDARGRLISTSGEGASPEERRAGIDQAVDAGRRRSQEGVVLGFKAIGRDQARKAAQAREMQRGNARGKILVVDDQEKNRKVLRLILSSSGYVVEEAGDGAQAVGMVSRSIPDLILLDIMMPGMDGIEAAGVIRKMIPALPIIMVTAFAKKDLVERARAVGVADFIAKPVDRAILLDKIDRVLSS